MRRTAKQLALKIPAGQLANTAAIIFVLLGTGIVIYGYILTADGFTWKKLVSEIYSNLGIEFVSIGLTVLVIEELNRRSARRERLQELILQMGSPNKDFAIEAVRILRYYGGLTNGSLQEAKLRHANLQDAILTGADLQRVDLTSANLQGANLRDADLREAQLTETNLQGAKLHGANLQNAKLFGADLQDARLYQASLQGAKLTNANLAGADFSDADLAGANLRGADLRGAIFTEEPDENTILPDGAKWTPDRTLSAFTDPDHSEFWRSKDRKSPAYQKS